MPAWVDRIILFAFRWIGVPILARRLPGVPREAYAIAEEALAHILAADDKPAAVENLKTKVRECTGVGCPPRPVRERIQP